MGNAGPSEDVFTDELDETAAVAQFAGLKPIAIKELGEIAEHGAEDDEPDEYAVPIEVLDLIKVKIKNMIMIIIYVTRTMVDCMTLRMNVVIMTRSRWPIKIIASNKPTGFDRAFWMQIIF